jgi:hypothetical protein
MRFTCVTGQVFAQFSADDCRRIHIARGRAGSLIPATPATAAAISTTTAISAAAAPVAATAAIASSTAAALFRTRFIHDDAATHEVLAIERLNCAGGFLIVGHFDETKTPKLSRHLIANQCDVGPGNTRLREPTAQILLGRLKWQIPNV